MSQHLRTIDLSSEDFKTVKKINSATVNNDFKAKGHYVHKFSPTSIVYWLKINKEELLGLKRSDYGTFEIDLEHSDQSVEVNHFIEINESLGITLGIRADKQETNFTPIMTFYLSYDPKLAINPDGNIQVLSKMFDSASKEIASRQKFSLSFIRQQKVCECKRDFDSSETRDLVLELYIDSTGFIKERDFPNGITNLGVTCYMNSYIQTIFHLKKFRYYINQLEAENSADFIFCLQSLFYSLEHGDIEAHTFDLVKAFGWNLEQMFMQQDVQEFSLKLLDAIEERSKRQGMKHIITKELFKGNMESYIKCVNIDFESKRHEDFYELQLNIKETNELLGALDQLLQQETLFGENAYDTEKFGKQDAIKGISLVHLPDVLVFNVNRSDYNLDTFEPVKLLKEFRFDEEIDLTNYSKDGGIYSLFAVFVHIGFDSGRGHYTVFVKPKEEWFEFNDEIVTKVAWDDVSKSSYGGKNREIIFDPKTFELKERLKDSPSHAYMLAYVRKNKLDKVVNNGGEMTPYPQHVSAYTDNKLKQIKKQRIKEDYYKVYFTTMDTFVGNSTGVGELFYLSYLKDPYEIKRFKQWPFTKDNIKKETRAPELNNFVKEKYGKDAQVYVFNPKRKLMRLVRQNHTTPQFDVTNYHQHAFVYIPSAEELQFPNSILLILKHYNEKTSELIVKSITLEDISATIQGTLEKILGQKSDNLAVFYEPNYNRLLLLHQEQLNLTLAELLTSKVKSDDVISLVYTSKTEESVSVLSALWNNFKDSIYLKFWLDEDKREDHVFNIKDNATVIYDYLEKLGRIDSRKNYTVTISLGDSQSTLKCDELEALRIGNLSCDDNNIIVSRTIPEPTFELSNDVLMYNFKNKQYTILNKNVEPTDDFEADLSILPNVLRKHPAIQQTLSDNTDFLNMRYRRYNIARYKQWVKLGSGEVIDIDVRPLMSKEVEAVLIVPVIAMEHKHHSNGGELHIKATTNGHSNGCCTESTININLHICRVTGVGYVLMCFTADQKTTFEDLQLFMARFVKKSMILVDEEIDLELSDDDEVKDSILMKFRDANGQTVNILSKRFDKIETQAVNQGIDVYLYAVNQPSKNLEIELSP